MSRVVKVADLIGFDLDLAVAIANGDSQKPNFVVYSGEPCLREEFDPEGPAHYFDHTNDFAMWWALRYSTEWAQGGPIIEREHLDLEAYPPDEWGARNRSETEFNQYGPSPLIAAMRAYVASKFGETVELP